MPRPAPPARSFVSLRSGRSTLPSSPTALVLQALKSATTRKEVPDKTTNTAPVIQESLYVGEHRPEEPCLPLPELRSVLIQDCPYTRDVPVWILGSVDWFELRHQIIRKPLNRLTAKMSNIGCLLVPPLRPQQLSSLLPFRCGIRMLTTQQVAIEEANDLIFNLLHRLATARLG